MPLKLFASLFNFIVAIEYITLAAAIILLHKKRVGQWRYFILLMLTIVIAETYGWYLHIILHRTNAWIFNINMIFTVMFMLWILSTAPVIRKMAKIIYGLMAIFACTAFLNLLFFQGYQQYDQYSEAMGDILQVVSCGIIFYALAREDSYRKVTGYEYFWLANGIMFSSMASAFLYIFPVIFKNFQMHAGFNIFNILNDAINLLLYGSLFIAFICRNRNTR